MGKVSFKDKMRIQTMCELGMGYKKITAECKKISPDKSWKLGTIQAICKRFRVTGSTVDRKPGSGRPKTARSVENVEQVAGLIQSQEDQPGTSKSTRAIAREVGICQGSVLNIVKKDLGLRCFKRTPAQVLSTDTKHKRLERCRQLLKRLPVPQSKSLFYTDEKVFHIDPPVSAQNKRVWAAGRKSNIPPNRLLVQRAKFSQRVMVSAGVCFGGKGKLCFVPEGAKINSKYYCEELLPLLMDDCNTLLQQDFVFQQDGAPAHTARQTQDWLYENCPDFITKDQWPPNSPDLNPLDFCVWGMMLDAYRKHRSKPSSKAELKEVLQQIWDSLPQDSIDRAILAVRKRLRACVDVDGGHFEHALR